jgi:hypothetical protein
MWIIQKILSSKTWLKKKMLKKFQEVLRDRLHRLLLKKEKLRCKKRKNKKIKENKLKTS